MHSSPSTSYLAPVGLIGSTNGVLQNTVYYSSDDSEWKSSDGDYTNYIEEWGKQYSDDRRVRRSVSQSRQDTISNINWSMTVLANGIKMISAILTILATDHTDR